MSISLFSLVVETTCPYGMPIEIPVVVEKNNLSEVLLSIEGLVKEVCPECPFQKDIGHGDILLIPISDEDNPPAEIPIRIVREGVEIS